MGGQNFRGSGDGSPPVGSIGSSGGGLGANTPEAIDKT